MMDHPENILPITGYNFTLAMNEIFGKELEER
jgi:hypothetical protein